MTTTSGKITMNGGATITTDRVLQVKPVRPDSPPGEELARDIVLAIGFLFLSAALVMVALGRLHAYLPAVPPMGYWDVFLVLIGLSLTAQFTIGRLQWKWARR